MVFKLSQRDVYIPYPSPWTLVCQTLIFAAIYSTFTKNSDFAWAMGSGSEGVKSPGASQNLGKTDILAMLA